MVKLAENAWFGFDKIESNWVACNHTQPEYQVEFDSIVLKMNMEESSEKTVEKTVEKTIIDLITGNPKSTTKSMMVVSGLTRRGVEYQLNKLKELGKIERVGPDKGGYWKVNPD